jgi:hypothetical protein
VTDAGGLTVIYGSRRGVTGARALFVSRSTKGVRGSASDGDELGATTAVLDVDGDRIGDVVAGAPGSAHGAGSLSLLYGGEAGVTAVGSAVVHADSAGSGATPSASDRFGAALAE